MIFDNAEDPTALLPLTTVESGHVLITSRNRPWQLNADVIEVDVLARPESVELLQRGFR